jgi:hypothetical protein
VNVMQINIEFFIKIMPGVAAKNGREKSGKFSFLLTDIFTFS